MKKTLPIIIFSIVLFTACKSNEDKALILIDKHMFSTLLDYESYEPIETVVTEANSSIYTDSLIRKYAIKAIASKNLFNESYKKAQTAMDYADIYVDSYSALANRKFNDYMKQVDKEHENMAYYSKRLKIYEDSIKLRTSAFKPEKIGWDVVHKFRCKTKGGNYSIGNYIYIIDNKFSEIIDCFDMDDDGEISVRAMIDSAVKED